MKEGWYDNIKGVDRFVWHGSLGCVDSNSAWAGGAACGGSRRVAEVDVGILNSHYLPILEC